MVSEINQTPKALRLHIGVFGRTNAGKSTLINAISGHKTALTSPIAGTTTDPVFKPMELFPLGAVVFIDTAGLNDVSELGEIRIKKSLQQLSTCDCAIIVVPSNIKNLDEEKKYIEEIKTHKIPYFIVVNQIGEFDLDLSQFDGINVVKINLEKDNVSPVKDAIIEILDDKTPDPPLTANLVKEGDLVILIAPQDIQAPKGRLILPEVQTLRDLLDNGCMVMTVTAQNIQKALDSLAIKPALVITDSQIFKLVNEIIPKEIPLSSFSILIANTKADIEKLVEGAKAIENLKDGEKVAILESCSHHALKDDIAREKLPKWLKAYTKKDITIEVISGQVVPEDLSDFKLAVHCGGCMVNRRAMLTKQADFEKAGVPMTNFGVAIAYMNGILDRVSY